MIPENKQPAVKKALRAAFNTDDFEAIQQLTRGLSGALVFKIVVDGIAYLLRIIIPTNTRDEPAYYFDCLQTAANAGIAPRIHYLSVEEKISITDFIEDQYFPVPEARIKMADALRDLHALPKFANQLNYVEASEAFLQKLLATNLVSKNDIKDILELYGQTGKVYPRNDWDNLVSCHNDMKRDNIIFDGVRPWLVDWEAARLNDRYVDLAAMANFVVKDDKDETEFLKRYFDEELDEYKRARFFLMKQIVHMLCFTLCTIVGAEGRLIDVNRCTPHFNDFHDSLWNYTINLADNTEKVNYGLVHLKELTSNMQTKRYDESLRIVAAYNKVRL